MNGLKKRTLCNRAYYRANPYVNLQVDPGNVTTTELWAISKLSVDDVDVVKGNHTAGTVTLEKMKYNTTFTALSKTLKS